MKDGENVTAALIGKSTDITITGDGTLTCRGGSVEKSTYDNVGTYGILIAMVKYIVNMKVLSLQQREN